MSSARLSARVESAQAGDQAGRTCRAISAKEGMENSTSAPARVTAGSASLLADRLADPDRRVIETLATVRLATGAQLRRLHWVDSPSGRRLARHHLAKSRTSASWRDSTVESGASVRAPTASSTAWTSQANTSRSKVPTFDVGARTRGSPLPRPCPRCN